MRPIMIIPVLLAVAVLFATAPALAAGDFELRVLEGPFTVSPTASASTAPAIFVTTNPSITSDPSIPAGSVRRMEDRDIR